MLSPRVVIAGAGALGSAYGGLLAAAGADVALLARGAHGRAMRDGGLTVVLPDREVQVTVSLDATARHDVVLLTAKAFDTAAVLDRVPGAPVLAASFQNGPGKNDALLERYGRDATAGAVSMIAAELSEPGTVIVSNLGPTYLAPISDRQAGVVRELADLLNRAGAPTRVADDAGGLEWSKLAQVAAVMALQAVTRAYLHEVFGSADGAVLIRRIVTDVAAVASASGSGLADWPGLLPVRTLADGSDDDAVALLDGRSRLLVEAGAVSSRTSMLQSLEAGRPTELEAIHGELVRRATGLGVAVPSLEAIYRLARLLDERSA